MLSEADRTCYAELLRPFMQGHPGWYEYQMKLSEFPEHIRHVALVMHQLLVELKPNYAQRKEYQVLERVFGKHFRLEKLNLVSKAKNLTDDYFCLFRRRYILVSQHAFS